MPPIPRDLPLSIPGSVTFFTILLVVGFVLHIFFVLLTVSGAVLSVVTEAMGHIKKDRRYVELAEHILTATSVNKSLAVVLGVAPLLLVGVLYTRFFYPPTVILGGAWLSIIWLLIVGFLLLYAYKFSWNRLQSRPGVHLLLGALGTVPFLIVPMIFVVTVGLMRRPDLWMQTHSFVQAMFYPTVWPRYLHVIAATMVLGGLLPVWEAWRHSRRMFRQRTAPSPSGNNLATHAPSPDAAAESAAATVSAALDSRWMAAYGLRWTVVALVIQIAFGLIVLLTMPGQARQHFLGGSVDGTLVFLLGIVGVAVSLGLAIFERHGRNPGRVLRNLGIALAVVLIAMGIMRLQVRDVEIAPYTAASSHAEQAAGH